MEATEAARLDGFLLTFPPKQYRRIKMRLQALGYAPDSDGLKGFIIDAIEGSGGPEFRIGGMLGEFLESNPATIAAGIGMAENLVEKFVRRMK